MAKSVMTFFHAIFVFWTFQARKRANQLANETQGEASLVGPNQPGGFLELCWVGYENDESHENIRYLGHDFLLLPKNCGLQLVRAKFPAKNCGKQIDGASLDMMNLQSDMSKMTSNVELSK